MEQQGSVEQHSARRVWRTLGMCNVSVCLFRAWRGYVHTEITTFSQVHTPRKTGSNCSGKLEKSHSKIESPISKCFNRSCTFMEAPPHPAPDCLQVPIMKQFIFRSLLRTSCLPDIFTSTLFFFFSNLASPFHAMPRCLELAEQKPVILKT